MDTSLYFKKKIDNGISNFNIKIFSPLNLDYNGNLMIYENSLIKSPFFYFEKGSYELIIDANSLPEKPINGENAHITINMSGIQIGSIYLSEKRNESKKTISFVCDKPKRDCITITYDNDTSINKLDRNVIIYNTELKKK